MYVKDNFRQANQLKESLSSNCISHSNAWQFKESKLRSNKNSYCSNTVQNPFILFNCCTLQRSCNQKYYPVILKYFENVLDIKQEGQH